MREDYKVRVPSPVSSGKYDIIIGVWDPEKKKRLRIKGVKATGGKDSIVIEILRIE